MRALILGGTGTLGTEITRQLLSRRGVEVTCFSRDEHKQKVLARKLKNERLRFLLGDIRDAGSVSRACTGIDTVFHVAALKHVDTGQGEVREFTATNLLGTFNVADAARDRGVKHVVFSSTDKAVDPINAYGALKFASEVYLYGQNRTPGPRFSVFRWGNVVGSTGSVIPEFIEQIRKTRSYSLTHPEMTRFWIPISQAVQFILEKYENAPTDRALVPPIRAARVSRVAETIADILEIAISAPTICGLRPGEKIHEVLSSAHTQLPIISSADPALQMNDAELRALLLPLIAKESVEKARASIRRRPNGHAAEAAP